ncbi:hypothetical protein [Polyangium spumosum]|uniref:Lipoprotein n=1 Tax=Polyangium spumosum TaxID=889282 RepID=A0A6N7PL72_9BACT|nr:hypothetical protein [Polyangium spumosum]MRG90855.1 hypothetical protein [Polyangium spumosum]
MTRIPKRLGSLLFALVALGCQGKAEPQAQDPAPQATAPEATPRPKKPTRPVKEYPAPESFTLAPPAVGQWIRLSVEPKGEPPSQMIVRIVGKEDTAFWYEIESNTPSGTKVVQLLLEEGARKKLDKSAVRKLRVKAGDAPAQEYAGPTINTAGDVIEEYVGVLELPELDKAERADVKVHGGSFKGCFVQDVERAALGVTTKARTFRHPAVPITGFVKSEGTVAGKPVLKELLELHETGAKSAMGL